MGGDFRSVPGNSVRAPPDHARGLSPPLKANLPPSARYGAGRLDSPPASRSPRLPLLLGIFWAAARLGCPAARSPPVCLGIANKTSARLPGSVRETLKTTVGRPSARQPRPAAPAREAAAAQGGGLRGSGELTDELGPCPSWELILAAQGQPHWSLERLRVRDFVSKLW